jgi:drug/metabolite transporter (DMT)-like permease
VLLPLAAVFWPKAGVSPFAWLSVLGIGVICTGIAYILYFRLIEHVSAAYGASVTFLIPVFGILWGKVFLNEEISQSTLIGAAVVLVGTALASGRLTFVKRYATT